MIFSAMPKIVVVGLGYVGLPLAVALGDSFETIGLDIDPARIRELEAGYDRTGEISGERLRNSSLRLTSKADLAHGADVYIVTVPTPVSKTNEPDLAPVLAASRSVAKMLEHGRPTIIIYESTVYPGVTEDICGPVVEAESGLRRGKDFWLAYSPERINPGDREHSVDRIVKVIAGENDTVTDQLANIYGKVTSSGTFRASSIKVAEAAKVIENAQRDINIAFMNEITQIFARLRLSIWDVLEAAGTKWNFLKFKPGLVGGHCIGVDPYYLSYLSKQLGHQPEVILAGRRINDEMGNWAAGQLHEARAGKPGRVLILGITFKENVPDIRNSKVIDIVNGLLALGHEVVVHDPIADSEITNSEYGLVLDPDALRSSYDVVLCAVAHDFYRDMDAAAVEHLVVGGGLLADLKGVWHGRSFPGVAHRWSL